MISTTNIKEDTARLKASANDLNDDLHTAAHRAGGKIRSIYNSASDEFNHASDVVGSEIRSNPVRASVIALGVGVLLGALIRR